MGLRRLMGVGLGRGGEVAGVGGEGEADLGEGGGEVGAEGFTLELFEFVEEVGGDAGVADGFGFGGEGGGGGELALVGEADGAEEGADVGGAGDGGVELVGGAGAGAGEVEVGLEVEGVAELGEGLAEALLAEPAAEEGGGGPVLGGEVVGVFLEGAEKTGLGAGGVGDVGHRY
jgi:hypothetical protein